MDWKKLLIVAITLLIIWGCFFWYLVNYGNEVRDHPCSMCAKKVGADVSCQTSGITRIFYPNGSFEDVNHLRRGNG